MITKENHLHDIYLIKKVVESIFNELKKKYDFRDYKNDFIDSYDCLYIAIEKNELIIYVFISKREAYELCFLNKGKKKWESISFGKIFSKVYRPFSKEEKTFFSQQYENSLKFDKYSFYWYEYLIKEEIDFIEEHCIDVFKKGVLTNFCGND
jgi:hypothetical protein